MNFAEILSSKCIHQKMKILNFYLRTLKLQPHKLRNLKSGHIIIAMNFETALIQPILTVNIRSFE